MPLFNKHEKEAARQQQNLAATGGNVVGSTTAPSGGPAAPGVSASGQQQQQHQHPAAGARPNLPGPAPNTAGPHKDDILNKLDPSVDSQSGRTQVLRPGVESSTSQMPAADGDNNPYRTQHTSRTANTLDPRVDSTQANIGAYTTGGTTGLAPSGAAAAPRHVPEGTYGPLQSRLGNTVDPRVDSDADNRVTAGMTAGQAGQVNAPAYPRGVAGPAPMTAGPHRHDVLNKLDPGVDARGTGH